MNSSEISAVSTLPDPVTNDSVGSIKSLALKGYGVSRLARRIRLKEAADRKIADQARCDKEMDEIHATINKNQEEYDKQLLTLSSGFLVLSLAFIKDIVHTNQAIHRGLLYASFIALSVCVLAVLASFQVSNEGHYKAKLYWENRRDGDGTMLFPYTTAKIVKYLNWFTGILFVVGIVLSMCFVITNLNREASMANQDTRIQDGQHMKIPGITDTVQKEQI